MALTDFFVIFLSQLLLPKCQLSYPCRNFTLEFPFTDSRVPQCGLYVVHGCNDTTYHHPIVDIGHRKSHYSILGKPAANQFLIHDAELQTASDSGACYSIANTPPLSSPSVSFAFASPNITVFPCFNKSANENIRRHFKAYNRTDCEISTVYYETPAERAPPTVRWDASFPCAVSHVPIKPELSSGDLFDMVAPDYILEWRVAHACYECHFRRGGHCVTVNWNEFYCRTAGNRQLKLILGICIPGAVVLAMLLLAGYIWQRKKKLGGIYLLPRNISSDPSSRSDIEDGSFNFGIPIFSYSELVEATNNFDSSKELGDGGFGTVYYGKLQDGREVAIKRLYEHNYKRVEQFLNEIQILTSLRHPNLVSLYGCTSRRSRELLLVYEYIPNGTVADHLHGERAKEAPLTWPVRMSIARETAAALAYLHKSVIIHRDVKTNNILLDNNFSVKVADFGLSRLFPTDVTHISTAPQGTPGYVDPEYHQCYQLTDKSDVYSFGVVLIELISSMTAVDISRHKHEINLANLAVNKIQKCAFDELIDPSTGYNSDPEVTRMTTSVAELAFRCLQLEKDLRPRMEEVVVILKDIQDGHDCNFEQMKEGNGNHNFGKIPPSPETDEAVLLKSKNYQSSPTAVTDAWISSCSTTASSVGS